jgi:hypothetical protein
MRREALRTAGFEVPETLTPDESIGLEGGEGAPAITPRQLLLSYRDLIVSPWMIRDDARREWLDGMRDAAETGTAAGIPLRGFLAKTGTVPSPHGRLFGVSGWAIVFDPSGDTGRLAFLRDQPGAKAAAALGALIARETPAAIAKSAVVPTRPRGPDRPGERVPVRATEVRVRLFEPLRRSRIFATNIGSTPVRARRRGAGAWIGGGARVEIADGDELGQGTWDLEVQPFGLVRRVRGSLSGRGGSAGTRVVLTTGIREYAEGVLLGELPRGTGPRAEELAAAILRFLARGARHGAEDVCDLSHCARFVGRGPDVEWTSPTSVRLASRTDRGHASDVLDGEAWARVVDASSRPGPWAWTAHCGGAPLSAHAVWGGPGEADDSWLACPRHRNDGSASAPWARNLREADLHAVFGEDVLSMSAMETEGQRATRVSLGSTDLVLAYDDLHRRLAVRMGWNVLPSPPDRFIRQRDGWRAEGRGFGHRVGICLAD